MFPDWFTSPDTIFKLVLWLLSPVYVWAVKKGWQKFRENQASNSERVARQSLVYYRKALDNPPSLLESVAYIVFALPLPIVSVMLVGTLYFVPFHPAQYPIDVPTQIKLSYIILFVLCFVNYVVFGVLTIHGIKVTYWLRNGEARYAENYKAGIQKKIDRLTKKFPNLTS